MKKPLFFLIFFLLVFSNFTFYINAEDPPSIPQPFIYHYPPSNSFGISSWTTVNWSYFEVNNCFSYETNSQELEIEWNKSNSVSKFKYKFKTNAYDLYYLNISFTDNNLNNVSFDIENFTFQLIYPDGSMFFNFTDIMNTTDFEYEYILNVDGFKLILSSLLDIGEWELDPWFGDQTDIVYASETSLAADRCYGINGSVSQSVTINNITIRFDSTVLRTGNIGKCAIYNVSCSNGQTFYYVTEEKTFDVDGDTDITFNFTSTYCLPSGEYFVSYLSKTVSAIPPKICYADSGGSKDRLYDSGITYSSGTLPSPYCGDTDARAYMYCSYTVGCAGGCVDECLINETSESPVNGTTGILTDFVNSSVFVSASCGLIDWVNISVNGVGFQNFSSSPINGTFWYNNTDVYCKNSYIWWCNTSCNGSLNSSWFSYTVNLNCCPFVNNSVPANGSSGVSTSTQYWYVDSYDQNNEKTDGTIVCTNGDSGSWSQKLNGTRSLKFDAGLEGGNNYTVWVNITDGECSNNYTFWFITSGWYNRCPDLDQIPIANESEGVYIDIDWWNMTVYDPDGNTTNGTIWIYSVENPSYYTNMSWFNQANGTQSLDLRNYTFSYDTNYTVNITITDGQCVRNRTYWFITQNAPFGNITWDAIEAWLQENGYIKLENDTMEIELTSSFLGVFITLVLFILFFIVGYTENKRSGGAFFMLSGFLLLSLEYLVVTSLDNISIALLSPFAIFIIVLGIRKWLYPAGKEKTKTEGQ